MKLEEAHKYIVDDNRGILEKPDYFVIEEKLDFLCWLCWGLFCCVMKLWH